MTEHLAVMPMRGKPGPIAFRLPEGVVVRHHSEDWIQSLTEAFDRLEYEPFTVTTMDGNTSATLQYLGRLRGAFPVCRIGSIPRFTSSAGFLDPARRTTIYRSGIWANLLSESPVVVP